MQYPSSNPPFCLLPLLFALLFTLAARGQSDLEVVPVQTHTSFSLSSASSVIGKTRALLPLTLPKNTVAWYYVATAQNPSSGTSTLNLTSELASLLSKGHPATALLSYLSTPRGDGKCDVYLLDEAGTQAFLEKRDWTGRGYPYYPEGTVESVAQAKVLVKAPTAGALYLGIKNPGLGPVTVSVEVAAIVRKPSAAYGSFSEERTDWQGSNAARHVQLQKAILDRYIQADAARLIGTARAREELKESVVRQIVQRYPFTDFALLEATKQQALLKQAYDAVSKSYYYTPTEEEQKALTYGNLAWKYFEKGDWDQCIEFSQKSLQVTPLFFVQCNLSLCYLLKGRDSEALEGYIEAVELLERNRQPLPFKKQSLTGVIQDLRGQQQQRGGLRGAGEAISILETKLPKL